MHNDRYERYRDSIEVINLLVFVFSDEMIHDATNYPRSTHDGKLAAMYGLRTDYLSYENTPSSFKILENRASVMDTRASGEKIIRARKSNESQGILESAGLCAVDLLVQSAMTNERKSAERGIKAFKEPFGRLCLPLSADREL